MASANQPHVGKAAGATDATAIEFLPDADEIERRPLPRSARITLHLLLGGLISFLVWASVSSVDVIVTARGRLVTPLPNIVVQPLETSIIQSIHVRPGQLVRKGDKLATLDATFAQADESQLRMRLDSLNTQWARIDAELSGELNGPRSNDSSDGKIQSRLASERQASYAAQLRRQNESIARLRTALESARSDEVALAGRVKVLREMDRMTDDLVSKQLAVKSRGLEVRDRLLEAERSMDMAKNRQNELRRELSAVEADKSSFETGWRQKMLEELLSVSRERDAVADQLQKANRRQSMVVLTAPADAVVLDVAKLSQGSIVKEAEPFFTLVPLGDVLEAEVQIDAQDIGYIKVGAPTHIKIDAYPFQKHGVLDAKLTNVSQDAFRRDPSSGAVGAAYYGGRVSLGKARLKDLPANAKLLPGMTLAAEIKVGQRTVMSYLLWPITKATVESLREP